LHNPVTNKQINKQTNANENISSLVNVEMQHNHSGLANTKKHVNDIWDNMEDRH